MAADLDILVIVEGITVRRAITSVSIFKALAALAVFVAVWMPSNFAFSNPLDAPMQFVLIHGDTAYCRPNGSCAAWIAAEGTIDQDTPGALQRMLKNLGNQKLPIVIRSPGGNVNAAIEMGKSIRTHGLTVVVGGTRLDGCPTSEPLCGEARKSFDGSGTGSVYSSGAICFSACPYVLAGGARRAFDRYAVVGVHQITFVCDETMTRYLMRYRIVNGHKQIVSKRPVSSKFVDERRSTKLPKAFRKKMIAYFESMGVNKGIVDLAMSASPAMIHAIDDQDAIKLGLTTDDAEPLEVVMAGTCPREQSLPACDSAAANAVAPPASTPNPVGPDDFSVSAAMLSASGVEVQTSIPNTKLRQQPVPPQKWVPHW
ncbi:hypothetical protein DTW90_08455 [Neorhizobium sp. P12A]|uniref:COG3904 family protein n=1 Tax=Neorhizobium sp. P12A TaxID=2268027 RepID=UPI0011EC21B8|nr:hypothetical protein [Neorhizobium sp. P12A]KAA0699413.1 hypothetical protein DTW90_08455 [Neorhizobium sp. P12A]